MPGSNSHGRAPVQPFTFYVPPGAPYIVPAGPYAPAVIRRSTPQRKPTRAVSRIVRVAPPQYNAGGQSPFVTVPTKTGRVGTGGPNTSVTSLWGSFVWGRDAWGINWQSPSGAAVVLTQRPPTRARSALKVSAVYNSGGIVPQVRRATQKPKPTRGASRLQSSASYNSGGKTPQQLAVVRQKPPRRKPPLVDIASPYNSGGATPKSTRAVPSKPKPLQKPPQRFTPPSTVAVVPTTPIVTTGKRPKPPTRGQSKAVVAGSYNSGGSVPLRAKAQQKVPKPTRAASRALPAPNFNSGGQTPLRTVATPAKPKPLRKAPQRFTPPATAAVIPTTPIVVVGKRQRPPTRATSRPVRSASYNGSGIRPVVTGALRRPPAKLRSFSHPIIAPIPLVVGPATAPTIISGERWKPAKLRSFSRPIVASSPVTLGLFHRVTSLARSTGTANLRPPTTLVSVDEPLQATDLNASSTTTDIESVTQVEKRVEGQP